MTSPILTRTRSPNVASICKPRPIWCHPLDTIHHAIRLMSLYKIGCVLVCEHRRPVGVLTRRDAMRFGAEGYDGETTVDKVMTHPVTTVDVDASVDELGILMMSSRIRHVAVVDAEHQLVGVVSESDIVNSHGLEHDLFLRSLYEVCNLDPLRIPSDCSLKLAIERIRTAGHTAALIDLSEGFAILTETDVIKLLAEEAIDLSQPVSSIALNPLQSVPGSLSLYNARRHFRNQGFRHLGVTDEHGQLVGLASYSDILRNVEVDYIYRLRELLNDRSHSLNQTRHYLRIIEKVINSSLEGILICDAQGKIQSVNPAFTQITGYDEWEVIGCNPSVLSSGRHDKRFYELMWREIKEVGHWQGEIWNRNKSGDVYPEWLSITAIENDNGEIMQYAAIFHDLTEVKRSEARINKMVYFDEVTLLPNRRLLRDRLDNALNYSNETGTKITLVNLDLDWFKVVNDRFGQVQGDQVLREIANRINQQLADEDTVARPGGDEFSLIISSIQDTDELAVYLQRLQKIISAPVLINSTEIRITCSMGVVVYPDDASDAESLMSRADSALLQAKEQGRNTVHYYSLTLNQSSMSRLKLASLLQNALEKNELTLYYQPKVCLKTGNVEGVESLIRWFNPELGQVSPSDFIPLAEDIGLIDSIGSWVLETSVKQSKAWQDQQLNLNIAVNVSARQFQRGEVAAKVMGLLDQYQLSPDHLSIELTETSFMHNAEKTLSAIKQLSLIGVKVAIDDFGTGYSSLNYVRTMPLSQLKVDLSFIKNIVESVRDRKLVQAIIDMAHALDIEVIAEGVETCEQLKLLLEMGCDQAQGYLFCQPIPAGEFEIWLQDVSQAHISLISHCQLDGSN